MFDIDVKFDYLQQFFFAVATATSNSTLLVSAHTRNETPYPQERVPVWARVQNPKPLPAPA
jgi:hypothetical protein